MAALTLDQIEAAVRFRGDYQNVRKFSQADVRNEIQTSFGEFYQLVASVHEGYWDTEATIYTVANTAYAVLPGDTWRVQAIDRLDSSGQIVKELDQVGIEHRNRYGALTGEPAAYRLTARGADLYPTPNAVYTLRVLYTPIAPSLSASQPREWFNGWEDYVITSTLLKLDTREGKPLTDRLTVLDKIEKTVRAGATERRSQEPEYLNLRDGVGGGPVWHEGDY